MQPVTVHFSRTARILGLMYPYSIIAMLSAGLGGALFNAFGVAVVGVVLGVAVGIGAMIYGAGRGRRTFLTVDAESAIVSNGGASPVSIAWSEVDRIDRSQNFGLLLAPRGAMLLSIVPSGASAKAAQPIYASFLADHQSRAAVCEALTTLSAQHGFALPAKFGDGLMFGQSRRTK